MTVHLGAGFEPRLSDSRPAFLSTKEVKFNCKYAPNQTFQPGFVSKALLVKELVYMHPVLKAQKTKAKGTTRTEKTKI